MRVWLTWSPDLLGLLGVIGCLLILWIVIRRYKTSDQQRTRSAPFAYSGVVTSAAPRPYSPDHVGNDASARPWEAQTQVVPAAEPVNDFDKEAFLDAAKRNFIALQLAWDRADVATLRTMMTDSMAAEISNQLADRALHVGAGRNQTEVVALDAKLLGIEELPQADIASVEFNGLIQESPTDGPNPFREVWRMQRAKNGASGWLVAGVQALQ